MDPKSHYRIIDKEKYYRKGVFDYFSKGAKCSTSMTSRIDVTDLVAYSAKTGTKFYLNFLYLLSKAMNSRDDYKMGYRWESEELICYDQVNPTQYVFHEDTETCSPVYSVYDSDYQVFYGAAEKDIAEAKKTREYKVDEANHPNWFDASYLSWMPLFTAQSMALLIFWIMPLQFLVMSFWMSIMINALFCMRFSLVFNAFKIITHVFFVEPESFNGSADGILMRCFDFCFVWRAL